MRKFQFFALVLAGIFLTACEKENPTDGGGIISDTFWECKIDGETFRIEGDYAYASEWDVGNKIGVYGSEDPLNSGYKSVFISLDDIGKVGTYKLGFGDEGEAVGSILYTADGSTFASRLESGTGTLEVSSIDDKYVEGTFNFTAPSADGSEVREVTDGKFKVKFQD